MSRASTIAACIKSCCVHVDRWDYHGHVWSSESDSVFLEAEMALWAGINHSKRGHNQYCSHDCWFIARGFEPEHLGNLAVDIVMIHSPCNPPFDIHCSMELIEISALGRFTWTVSSNIAQPSHSPTVWGIWWINIFIYVHHPFFRGTTNINQH